MKKGHWLLIIAFGFGISTAVVDCGKRLASESGQEIKVLQKREAMFAACEKQHPGASRSVFIERVACIANSEYADDKRNNLRSRLIYCQRLSPVFGHNATRGKQVEERVKCLSESTYCPAWLSPSEAERCRRSEVLSTQGAADLQTRFANWCAAVAPNSTEAFTQCMLYYLDLELVGKEASEWLSEAEIKKCTPDAGACDESRVFERKWTAYESKGRLPLYLVPLVDGSMTAEAFSLALEWVSFGLKLGFLSSVTLILASGFIVVLRRVNLSSATAYRKFLANELRKFRKDSPDKSLLQKGATAAFAATFVLTLGVNITVNGVRYYESTRSDTNAVTDQSPLLLEALRKNRDDLRGIIARGECMQASLDALAVRITSLDALLQTLRNGRATQETIHDHMVRNEDLLKNLVGQSHVVSEKLSETNRILGGIRTASANQDSQILGQLSKIIQLLQGFEKRLSAPPPNTRTPSEEVYGSP